jgi:DNA-directed RNA polymerase specialized sigma24 family protein
VSRPIDHERLAKLTSLEEISRIVWRVVRAYKRKCWWMDEDDAYQVGVLVCLQAVSTCKESSPVPYAAYAHRAAVLEIRRLLWRTSHPVHAPPRERQALRELHFVSLDNGIIDPRPTPEEDTRREERRARVRQRVAELGSDLRHGDEAGRVLLDEGKPGRRPRAVVAATWRLRRRCTHDPTLYRLWQELEA